MIVVDGKMVANLCLLTFRLILLETANYSSVLATSLHNLRGVRVMIDRTDIE